MMKKDAQGVQPRAKLIEARGERKLSQQQLAERIGTNYVNVSRWERGITRPGPYFRRKLSRLFGKTEEELDLALAADTPATSTTPSTSHAAAPVPNATASIHDAAIPLPPPVPLVGREAELAELRRRLRASDSVAMTALHGLPGVGKTTLAVTLARDAEMHAHFRDGILWAALGPDPDVSSILSRWALLLGVATSEITGESDHEALALQLRRAIGTRCMLLVIDDAWKLEDALLFKVGGPNCAHLVTTRFPGIASAFAPHATSVIRELGENESILLLRVLAPQVMEREKQKVHDLVVAAGGLPLALTLLGNYLRLQSYSGPARRVDAALARLNDAEERLYIGEPRGPTERHTSLQVDMPLSLHSVIDVTVQQLASDVKATLCALSVFPPKPGNFSEEAALYVADCDVVTLDALMDRGLLESADASHYTLHQTIADYARVALQGDPAPYAHLITYMTNFVEQHKKEYEVLEPEYNSIIAALEAAYKFGKTEQLMRCVYAFIPYLRSRGLYELAEKQLQRAIEGAAALKDDDGRSHALLYLGEIAQKRGNYELANAYLLEGLSLARQLANPKRISAMLAGLGWITWKRGEYTRAETYLKEGLSLARQIENSELICDILETLGSVVASRGEYDKSKVFMKEALALARKIGDREKICTLLINLGVTEGEQGDNAQAEIYFKEGLDIAQHLGHREWVSLLLSNLGHIASERGHYSLAESYFQDGLEMTHNIGNHEWESALLSNLGEVIQKQGFYTQAEKYFQESINLARKIGRPHLIANALYEYGNLYLIQKQIEDAETTFREMLTIIPIGDQELLAVAKYGQARIAYAHGKTNEARNLGELSLRVLEAMGHHKTNEIRIWLNSVIDEKEQGFEE